MYFCGFRAPSVRFRTSTNVFGPSWGRPPRCTKLKSCHLTWTPWRGPHRTLSSSWPTCARPCNASPYSGTPCSNPEIGMIGIQKLWPKSCFGQNLNFVAIVEASRLRAQSFWKHQENSPLSDSRVSVSYKIHTDFQLFIACKIS